MIHGGTYRETVQPAMGGINAEKIISYEAFEGEKVIIKASVDVKDFKLSVGWRMTRGYVDNTSKTEEIKVWEIQMQ